MYIFIQALMYIFKLAFIDKLYVMIKSNKVHHPDFIVYV
ncbi:hypothetical protein DF16_orf02703 [Bacillus thuringiensis serovar kurstaki str. YBT-1520]|nr:hypothetical protein HD73_3531 [Bacillus thuringiensis serovar kurstaki str. HD73]AIM31118.1 hypothetical protein DF16_orf02703 [Bacillus thuringiensis serovar kurstaki str. YBT-1520]